MRRTFLLAASLIAVSAMSASAQGKGRNTDGIPPGQRPPAGMCRIWINGVPPGHQPAPTDCTTAQLSLPANARIIYGDNTLTNVNSRVFTRLRELSNGTWVTDRFRQDANGNVFLLNSTPVRSRSAAARGKGHGNDNELENDNDNDQHVVNGVVVPRGNEVEGDHGGGRGHDNGKSKGKGKGHD